MRTSLIHVVRLVMFFLQVRPVIIFTLVMSECKEKMYRPHDEMSIASWLATAKLVLLVLIFFKVGCFVI